MAPIVREAILLGSLGDRIVTPLSELTAALVTPMCGRTLTQLRLSIIPGQCLDTLRAAAITDPD